MATATAQPGFTNSGAKKFSHRLRGGDEIAWLITFLFALSVLAITALLIGELWYGSAGARLGASHHTFRAQASRRGAQASRRMRGSASRCPVRRSLTGAALTRARSTRNVE